MPTIVGILIFISRKNFMLNWVECEKSFITSSPGPVKHGELSSVSSLNFRTYPLFSKLETNMFCRVLSKWKKVPYPRRAVGPEVINHTYPGGTGLGSSVGCSLDWWSGGREFTAPVRQHSFVEIDHEIFSTVILSLPLIQEGKLSVTCERMCTEYWLTA